MPWPFGKNRRHSTGNGILKSRPRRSMLAERLEDRRLLAAASSFAATSFEESFSFLACLRGSGFDQADTQQYSRPVSSAAAGSVQTVPLNETTVQGADLLLSTETLVVGADLIGIDFGSVTDVSPTNWTLYSSGTDLLLSDLPDESGTATAVDLLIDVGPASLGRFEDFIPPPGQIPQHTQLLTGLDGNFFDNAGISVTFQQLFPLSSYEVYVFSGDTVANDQSVTISGAGTVQFNQDYDAQNLFINDEVGDSARSLSSYAELVESDANGEIRIDVESTTGFWSLAGIAIRAVPGEIQGRKWNDLDDDGAQEPGEPGLAGVTIYLDLNDNGQLDAGEPNTLTLADDPATLELDESGLYSLAAVAEGMVTVREVIPPGFIQTAPVAQGNFILWDEVFDGDLSNDRLAPTPLTLVPGENRINGTVGPGVEDDVFVFTVPAGSVVDSITVLNHSSPTNSTFLGIDEGATYTATTNPETLGFITYNAGDIGSNLLPELASSNGSFLPPLSAGTYSIWIDEGTGPEDYAISIHLRNPTMLWDEGIDGDLSNDRLDPTPLTLAPGMNLISGSVGPGSEDDVFRLNIPDGTVLESITVLNHSSPTNSSFLGVDDGATYTAATNPDAFGFTTFNGGDNGQNLLPLLASSNGNFTTPLTPGTYTFWIDEGTGPISYSLLLNLRLPDTIWDESLDGDLSNDKLNPTELFLSQGPNIVRGSVGPGSEDDVFRITIPENTVIGSVVIQDHSSQTNNSFMGVDAGPIYTAATNPAAYGFTTFSGADVGTDVLPALAASNGNFSGALLAGTYTFWIDEGTGPEDYAIQFNVATTSSRLETSTVSGDKSPGIGFWTIDLRPGSVVRHVDFGNADVAAPVVTLVAPSITNDRTPRVTVTVTDGQSMLPDGTAVALDVDLNRNGRFTDLGENGYSNSTLIGGSTSFDVTPALPDGVYPMRARVTDPSGNQGISSQTTTTIDTVAPTISDIIVDDGTRQRSAVRAITVRFDSQVLVDSRAIELANQSGTRIRINVATSEILKKTVANVTFQGSEVDSTGSLIDGRYAIRILDGHVSDLAGNVLDGDGDGKAGGAAVDEFFRFYGDTDGDSDVDGQDYVRFGLAFLNRSGDKNYNPSLDYDDDGDIDGQDYGQFGRRFLKSI